MRSGTTLLRLMLASHPRLAIPPESHFLPELIEFEESSARRGLAGSKAKVIEWLISHRRLADFNLGADWIRTSLDELEPFTTRAIAFTLFSEYARREGKPRWGDKTPRYRSFIPQLWKVFPEAKFIHVLRDGRDTALSAWRAQFGPKTWVSAVYGWRESIRDVQKGQRSIPGECFMEVRYEELVLSPQAVLVQVCSFLGEQFDAKMLRFTESARNEVPAWESAWHSKLQMPLDPANIGKWRTQLSSEQLLLFERMAGKELTAAGYASSNVRSNAVAKAKCVGTQLWFMAKNHIRGVKTRLSSKGKL